MPIGANIIESLFSLPISVFASVLTFLHGHVVGGSWGLAIVLLTVIVRTLMLPLAFRQLHASQKLRMLAPQVKEIQARYASDRLRQNQEIKKLYRESGVKLTGPLIPLMIQVPVGMSLYYALREKLKLDICGQQLEHYFHVASMSRISPGKLRSVACNHVARHSAKFLFLGDITAPSTGLALILLLVLYVLSQMASALMASAGATVPGSKVATLLLPLLLVLFIYSFPPGLLVYWITTNFWTAGQQYFIRRIVGPSLAATAVTVDGSVGTAAVTPPRPARPKKRKRSGRRR
jgi:YidC/Oxa1 family membrane protein insertase